MKVIFNHNAFVDGTHYRRDVMPQTVPDHLRDKLPKSAKVVEGKVASAPVKAETKTFKDFDEARPASDAEQKINNSIKK